MEIIVKKTRLKIRICLKILILHLQDLILLQTGFFSSSDRILSFIRQDLIPNWIRFIPSSDNDQSYRALPVCGKPLPTFWHCFAKYWQKKFRPVVMVFTTGRKTLFHINFLAVYYIDSLRRSGNFSSI